LKAATKQLHHGLSLLLNYRVLNHSAIVKLCARYDKCVDTKIATEQIVPLSTALQFYSSDQLPELVASLEVLFSLSSFFSLVLLFSCFCPLILTFMCGDLYCLFQTVFFRFRNCMPITFRTTTTTTIR
jgi:hypothetical protein